MVLWPLNNSIPQSSQRTAISWADTKDDGKFVVLKSTDEQRKITDVSLKIMSLFMDLQRVGKVEKMTKLRDGNLLIRTVSEAQAKKLLSIGVVSMGLPSNDFKVQFILHKTLNNVEGSIYSERLAREPIEDLLEILKPQKVIKIHRITRKSTTHPGKYDPTPIHILTFEANKLPTEIVVLYERYRVKPHYPRPMRCILCQQFNHTQKFCQAKAKKCPECAENLPHDFCGPKKCLNCDEVEDLRGKSGDHAAGSRNCPSWLRECEIKKIQVDMNLSYHKAKQELKNRLKLDENKKPTFSDTFKDSISAEMAALRKELKELKDSLAKKTKECEVYRKLWYSIKKDDFKIQPLENPTQDEHQLSPDAQTDLNKMDTLEFSSDDGNAPNETNAKKFKSHDPANPVSLTGSSRHRLRSRHQLSFLGESSIVDDTNILLLSQKLQAKYKELKSSLQEDDYIYYDPGLDILKIENNTL